MRRRTWIRRSIFGIFALFLLIQLVPVWLWQTNPPVQAEPRWDSPQSRAVAQRACFDCHSNETRWPIYTRVAPASWLATWDVVQGRQKLNFSEWGVAQAGEGQEPGELAKAVQNGEMPPSNYLLIHPDARLSAADQQLLLRSFPTFGTSGSQQGEDD
jgi:hypothetical protein